MLTVPLLLASTRGSQQKESHHIRFAMTLTVGAFILTTANSAQAQLTTIYTVHDLGTLGGTTSIGRGTNSNGQVTGQADIAGNGASHAYRSDPNGGTLTDFGTLGGTNSRGYGINNRGEVAGYSDAPDGTSHAFRSSANGQPAALTDLGNLPADTSGAFTDVSASGINDSGMVVGIAATNGYPIHGFRSSPTRADGSVTLYDLGLLAPNTVNRAYGINNAGQVAGHVSLVRDGATVAYRSSAFDPNNPTNVTLENLGSLGGFYTTGYSINNSGQVAGDGDLSDGISTHAFRSSKNGDPVSLLDLGTLGGANSFVQSGTNGINSAGQVVGESLLADNLTYHAFLYSDNLSGIGGTMFDLNNYLDPVTGKGWFLTYAESIRDNGYISGVGRINGVQHAFLLTPGVSTTVAPEPGSIVLLMSALPVVGAVLARRRGR